MTRTSTFVHFPTMFFKNLIFQTRKGWKNSNSFGILEINYTTLHYLLFYILALIYSVEKTQLYYTNKQCLFAKAANKAHPVRLDKLVRPKAPRKEDHKNLATCDVASL